MIIDKTVLDEFVLGIVGLFGDRVQAVILYGSVARGTAEKDSDVDIAVITDKAFSPVENDRLADMIVDLELKGTSKNHFEKRKLDSRVRYKESRRSLAGARLGGLTQ